MAQNAVGSLVQTLASLLLKEGTLTWRLHEEIKEIKFEFQSIQSFLKDADMRQHTQQGLRTWVQQVRNMAYEVEDIIEQYTYFMAKYHKQGLQGAIYNTIYFSKKVFYQHRIAGKLQHIKSSLKVIKENSSSYSLSSDGVTSNEEQEGLRTLGESSAYLPEDDLVGIERSRDLLISWLTNEEPQRMAYSVVGMGGLGKTTLVGRAYHKVKNYFNCCAWVTVSQSFDTKKILRSMTKEFMGPSQPNNCDGMEYKTLVEILINHLQAKRYVLILDDVWSIDAWDQINVAIPKNSMGSRIMITTRDKGVASHVAELQSHVFHLQHLDDNEAWTLFCQRAFKNNPDGACPDELESSARNIVNKCDGLPLAIITTGSLMSSKKKVAEWRNVQDSFGWVLSNNRFLERVKKVLLLSYYELPIHLKQCFLHFCTFPEDHIILGDRLIRIWRAEGFVEKIEGLTLEDAAMNYIDELTGRCMIQYVNQDTYSKKYQMHDVMREIGVSIAEDENFTINSNEREEPQDNINARRLLVQVDSEANLLRLGTSNLRSCIVIPDDISATKYFNPSFKLLRVLDLRNVPLQKIPNSVGELFNLRYLDLHNSRLKKLPNSMERLRNLQTLDIIHSDIQKLPSWIVKLKKMRHLILSSPFNNDVIGVKVPTGICMLKSLHTLVYVEGNSESLKEIGNLTQLKHLRIESVVNGVDLCASLQRMKSLLYLTINSWKSGHRPLELEALSSPPPLLRYLLLSGKLERLPHWIGSLKNLVEFELYDSHLSADPLSLLQVLPNLEFPSLSMIYDGNQFCFRAPFFPKLRRLRLGKMGKLDTIEIEDGAMCHLQWMYLFNCQELKTLPLGIEYLRQLKELFSYGMPKEFTNRLGPGGTVEDQSKIQHIAYIKYN